MENTLFLVGLNHRTAPVDVREKFALASFTSPETWAVPLNDGIEEALILSTCNRVEVLVAGEERAAEAAINHWCKARGLCSGDIRPYLYCHQQQDAVLHLFTVASSLDSLVLGEPQILGQLKEAYRLAVHAGCTGQLLNRLLHKAFSVAKRVRTETAVASSAVSISYAAVELAKRIFDDMSHQKALLIGAGEMAELAAMHIIQAGIKKLTVTNRTFDRARELAERMHAVALPYESMLEALVDTDIVISSTGAPAAIITAADIAGVMRRRKQKPMFFIDIAMPRDIAPEVNHLDNVYLYDIDDLKEVVEENRSRRSDEAAKADAIVREEVAAFSVWMESLKLQPTIVDIVRRGENAAAEETRRALKLLTAHGPVDEHTREIITHMAASLARKLNHEPLQYLKNNHRNERESIETVRKVLGLEG